MQTNDISTQAAPLESNAHRIVLLGCGPSRGLTQQLRLVLEASGLEVIGERPQTETMTIHAQDKAPRDYDVRLNRITTLPYGPQRRGRGGKVRFW